MEPKGPGHCIMSGIGIGMESQDGVLGHGAWKPGVSWRGRDWGGRVVALGIENPGRQPKLDAREF